LGRDGATNAVIWVYPESKCFCREDWTGQIRLICLQKLDFWKNCAMARRAGGVEENQDIVTVLTCKRLKRKEDRLSKL
jgi:hypothetical protein